MQTIDILNVTQEQIDRCHRIIHENTGEVFYQVESESDSTVEYEVHFIKGRGFTCTCRAGQEGFHHCSKGTCKHCRWSVAHAIQFRQEQAERAEQAQIESYVRQGVDRATATRVVYAQPQVASPEELAAIDAHNERCNKGFQLMR